MCRSLLVVVVAVAALGVSEVASQQAVGCPEPKTQSSFEADNFVGSWYEMKRVPWDFDAEDDGECGVVRYSWAHETAKDELKVENTYYLPQNKSVSYVTLSAVADDITNGKLSAAFQTRTDEVEAPDPPFKYWVLGTDYTTYAVVYSCREEPGAIVPHINLWVLTPRPSVYTQEVDAKATTVIKAAGLDPNIVRQVKHQEGCPSIDSCKECSSPVASLDLEKFKEPWWNVQHSPYAEDSDRESCRATEFIPRSTGMPTTVRNSKILELTPENQDAWEVSESEWRRSQSNSNDGSFDDSLGSRLCVQGTDYDNWAVVSFCWGADRRGNVIPMHPYGERWPVAPGGVFVLSRKRGLTPEQQMEANKAVAEAGIPVANMQATPSTPCPKALLPTSAVSAASATKNSAILLLSVLAIVVGCLRTAPCS